MASTAQTVNAEQIVAMADAIKKLASSNTIAAILFVVLMLALIAALAYFVFAIWNPMREQHSAVVKDALSLYEPMKQRAEKAELELKESQLKYETMLQAAKEAGVTQVQLEAVVKKVQDELARNVKELKEEFKKTKISIQIGEQPSVFNSFNWPNLYQPSPFSSLFDPEIALEKSVPAMVYDLSNPVSGSIRISEFYAKNLRDSTSQFASPIAANLKKKTEAKVTD